MRSALWELSDNDLSHPNHVRGYSGAAMTHSGGKPHATGDRGQRYEVRVTGWPNEGKTGVLGWTDDLARADKMAASIRKAPGCTSTEIFDRLEDRSVITQYAGILR